MKGRFNNNNSKAHKRPSQSKTGALTPSHPPPFTAQSVRSIKLRSIASGAVTQQAFTYSNLSSMLGIVSTAATAAAYISTVFRIKRITIWGPVAVAGTPVQVTITFTETSNDFESPPISRSDTSISFDHPAFVTMKPPKGSLLSKWHGSAQTDEAFALTFPAGSIVDMDFDFVLNDLGAPLVGVVVVGATPGQIYHKTVNSLVPTVVNTI